MPNLVIVSIVWGFSFVLIKGALGSLDANFVSFARLLLSFLVFLPFVRFRGMSPMESLHLLAIGAVQFGFMYVAYVAAYQYLPAHIIALMTTTTPLFVTICNDAFAGKVQKTFFIAALLAVAAGAVIQLPDQSPTASLRGIVLIQLSNAAFACGQVVYKKWMAARPLLRDTQAFAFMYCGAVLVAGACSLFTTTYSQLQLEARQVFVLLYLGLIASGLCFFMWNAGARKVNEGVLAVMNNLKIPVGVVASLILLRENADIVRLFIGCGLFAVALWMNWRYEKRHTI